jgi:hypothetical protein
MEETLAIVAQASTEYVGRWNRLVSTTNWEKGRIIFEWRLALEAANAPVAEYSDEAWSRQVGGVTPQHVGRLRRVYERFGQVRDQYHGLYWSHFQAAVDWDDAEMWLEGAVQSRWSVARMSGQRWEAMGAPAESQPQESDFITNEVDEDVVVAAETPATEVTVSDSVTEVHGESDADGRNDAASYDGSEASESDAAGPFDTMDALAAESPEPVRPFADLPAMPGDMSDAFDLFKLAILNHKVSGWQEIARSDVLNVLESLKQLVLAPTE